LTRRRFRRDPLTLSSPTKATPFPIILWRCWAAIEHGITQPRPHDLRWVVRRAAGLKGQSAISANEAIAICAACALVVIRYAKIHGTKHRPWLTALLARRPTKVAAIALANKIARTAWAMMAKCERYREPVSLAA
jgi:hypothetical protein